MHLVFNWGKKSIGYGNSIRLLLPGVLYFGSFFGKIQTQESHGAVDNHFGPQCGTKSLALRKIISGQSQAQLGIHSGPSICSIKLYRPVAIPNFVELAKVTKMERNIRSSIQTDQLPSLRLN